MRLHYFNPLAYLSCAYNLYSMDDSVHFSQKKSIFNGKESPEEGYIVGYAAIIDALNLQMPMIAPVSLVCTKTKATKQSIGEYYRNSNSYEKNIAKCSQHNI